MRSSFDAFTQCGENSLEQHPQKPLNAVWLLFLKIGFIRDRAFFNT
jgi:hypothetical protein